MFQLKEVVLACNLDLDFNKPNVQIIVLGQVGETELDLGDVNFLKYTVDIMLIKGSKVG